MKLHCLALLLLLSAATGCVTSEKAEADARAAFFAGQASALNQLRLQQATADTPVVTVNGAVKNRVVPWTEELSLVKALVAAEYVGAPEIFSITVTRGGKDIPVSPQRLLSGNIDPLLEAGDVITLR